MPTIYYRKPGRPKGSATKQNTVGKQRARRYFELTIDDGILSTAAARQVAAEFGTTESDVFKAKKRHEPALAEEAVSAAIEIERQNSEMVAISEMGPHELRGRAWLLHLIRQAVKGNAN